MDPATIVASVAALLTPYLKKAGEEFVGEASEYVLEKAKSLWQKLRAKLDGNPQSKQVLDRYERDPAAHDTEFQGAVKEKLALDAAFAKDIAAELAEIKRRAPQVRVVQRMKEAEDVVGVKAKRLKSGAVDVEQHLDKAKGVKGAELDEIG